MKLIVASLCAVVIAAPGSVAHAQNWPGKPVKIVLNYTAGGPTDLTARMLGQKFAEYTGQSVVVENMPSANGVVGTTALIRSAPDGHTLMLSTAGHTAIAKALKESKLPFDPFRELAPISNLVNSNQCIIASPSLGVKSIADLVKLAKSKPGQISYGSVGVGSPNHLGIELLKTMAGIDMVHVPYKGTAPVMQDLLAGRVSLMLNSTATVIPHIKSGKLIALASGSAKRSVALPDVPTMQEIGYPGYLVYTWYALFAPAKTPSGVIARINELTKRALAEPEMNEKLGKQGAEPFWSTPEFLAKQMREEYERWVKVIKTSKINVN